MKIALAQLNFTVADVSGNAAKIQKAIREAEGRGADLILLPELALLGYPPKDILLNADLIRSQEKAIKALARSCRRAAAYVGWAGPNQAPGKPLFNSASLLYQGKILATHHKVLLPYYDVFDEERYFTPGVNITRVQFKGRELALTICEDIWNDKNYSETRLHKNDPLESLKKSRVDLALNISASPYWLGKPKERERMISAIARRYRVPIALANLVGGNDELVFDGASLAFNRQGKVVARGPKFKEGIVYVELAGSSPAAQDPDRPEAETYEALVLGLADYVSKCGMSRVVLGLSGGIDSSLVASVAADALGPKNVLGVLLPSRYSSGHSEEDAAALAKNLGIEWQTISIEPIFEAYLKLFAKIFPGLAPNIAEENIQARIRGAILMAISNKRGHMVLGTGNKSELAMGYCTLYGDLMGGLAPISDLTKTWVYRVARHRNSVSRVIPERVFTKAPSAELKPDQTDQDTLPPYDLLDKILELYIVEGKSYQEISRRYPADTVRRVLQRVDANEFKRHQAPPGLKITKKAFGFGRRMPLAVRMEHERQ